MSRRLGLAALVLLFVAIALGSWRNRAERLEREGRLASVSVSRLPDSIPGDTVPTLRFRVCNNGYRVVTRVEFSAQAFTRGEPTAHPVEVSGAPRTFTVATPLRQASCAETSFEGPFAVRDSVAARVTSVASR